MPYAGKAVPHPNHAGSRQRFCVHANTHGIARSASSSPSPPPRAATTGREPISSSASSSTGVKLRKKRGKPGPPRRARGRPPCAETRRARSSCPARPRSAAPSPRRGKRGQQRRRDRRLEVALREPGQAVLEGDRLTLLGQLEPAVDRAWRLREDRRRVSGRRRGRRSRRGRGTASARRPARRASATSSSCAR